ncbi:MAG TPA: hypothetical protein VKM54_22340 [Myxococcota bacterium]|nr:hypothetical protein [Myxococcota bacterium]
MTATRGGAGPGPGILLLPRDLDLGPGMSMSIAAKPFSMDAKIISLRMPYERYIDESFMRIFRPLSISLR